MVEQDVTLDSDGEINIPEELFDGDDVLSEGKLTKISRDEDGIKMEQDDNRDLFEIKSENRSDLASWVQNVFDADAGKSVYLETDQIESGDKAVTRREGNSVLRLSPGEKISLDDKYAKKLKNNWARKPTSNEEYNVNISVKNGSLVIRPGDAIQSVFRREFLALASISFSVISSIEIKEPIKKLNNNQNIIGKEQITKSHKETANRMFSFLKNAVVGFGRGAPELEKVGEIDLLSHRQFLEFVKVVREELDIYEERRVEKPEDDQSLVTTTGPVGMDIVAASMGYKRDSPGKYDGKLPYIFDLGPTPEHEEMSLSELRENRTNWPIKATKHADEPTGKTWSAKEASGTLTGTKRTKYEQDYGMIIKKPLYTEMEDLNSYFNDIKEKRYNNNYHLIIAGSHGEGTFGACKKVLHDGEILKDIEEKVGRNPGGFQVVFEVEINEYNNEKLEGQDNPVDIPKFEPAEVEVAEGLGHL